MNPKILKLNITILLLLLFGAGCEKNEINSNNKGIVGTWQLVLLPENCVGFGDIMIEISPDSVFKKYIDGGLDLTSTFTIKSGSMGYDTIFFYNPNAQYEYEEIALIGNDTLHLVSPVLTATATCNYFKRKK